jgi:hypothetical protein
MADDKNSEENWAKYASLRSLALGSSPQSLKLKLDQFGRGEVFGALMEFSLSGACVTLFCSLTGDASLYTSKGFGVIGGFLHDRVRLAAQAFVELCDTDSGEMTPVDAFPGPRQGWLRFYALTERRILMAEVSEASLDSGNNFTPLRNAGHRVISELRNVASTV